MNNTVINNTGLKDQVERHALEVMDALLDDLDKNVRLNAAVQFLHALALERERTITMAAQMEMHEQRDAPLA